MAEYKDVAKQIARDICRDNKICTCKEKDGHCVSVIIIAENLAKQGYRPPTSPEEGECINRAELIENLEKFAPEHFSDLIRMLIMKQPAANGAKMDGGKA